MNQPLTPDVGFLGLLVIGGLAGWIVGAVLEAPHWMATNILIGLAGSWIGSQLAGVAGVVVRGSLGHFIASLIGALLIVATCQRFHQEARGGDPEP